MEDVPPGTSALFPELSLHEISEKSAQKDIVSIKYWDLARYTHYLSWNQVVPYFYSLQEAPGQLCLP